jgi:hypothetical protein
MNQQQTYKESSFYSVGWMRGAMLVYDDSVSRVFHPTHLRRIMLACGGLKIR